MHIENYLLQSVHEEYIFDVFFPAPAVVFFSLSLLFTDGLHHWYGNSDVMSCDMAFTHMQ